MAGRTSHRETSAGSEPGGKPSQFGELSRLRSIFGLRDRTGSVPEAPMRWYQSVLDRELTPPLFLDRIEAGRILGRQASALVRDKNVLVLALPRGGVPVGFEVARALGADLDVLVVRKLGVPEMEEMAIGAIASGGIRILNHSLLQRLRISAEEVKAITAREQQEIDRRELVLRGSRPVEELEGRTVILVDDGLATGATVIAAAKTARLRHPERIIVAVPIASPEAYGEVQGHVDQVICPYLPDTLGSVGAWYDNFTQVTDREVIDWLDRAAHPVVT